MYLLAAALLSAEPTYSPHGFSDRLVLARRLLLGSDVLYSWIVLLFRMLRALIAAPGRDGARRGFDLTPPNIIHQQVGTAEVQELNPVHFNFREESPAPASGL